MTIAHQLTRFTKSLHNEPHLISQEAFRTITEYLDSRNSGQVFLMKPMQSMQSNMAPEEPDDLDDLPVAVINIYGSLTYRETEMSVSCGLTTYEGILEQAEDALENGCKHLVLNIDSGGGMAYGCFETANELREMADEAGATIWAYIDGNSCSAAYALTCVADYVVSNKDSCIGSIGVLISLVDNSAQMEKQGIKMIYITDGASKVPFDESGAFKKEFLDELQAKATRLGNDFRDHVSTYTGMTVQDLKDTQAKVFEAPEALSLGFINAIMSKSDFVDYVIEQIQGVSEDA